MKAKQLRELSVEELKQRNDKLRRECVLMRLQNAAGQLENTARIGQNCKEIARIMMILGEREIAAAAK